MPHVLFVCTGNICRSPFAERIAQQASGGDWEFSSAGIAAMVGWPMDQVMATELARHGGDAAGFRARQLTPAMLGESDLVLVMERAHRSWIVEEAPTKRHVTFGLAQFVAEATKRQGLSGVDLIEAVASSRAPMLAEHEVADPYRRGRKVGARIGDEIDQLVRDVVGALSPSAG